MANSVEPEVESSISTFRHTHYLHLDTPTIYIWTHPLSTFGHTHYCQKGDSFKSRTEWQTAYIQMRRLVTIFRAVSSGSTLFAKVSVFGQQGFRVNSGNRYLKIKCVQCYTHPEDFQVIYRIDYPLTAPVKLRL